MEAFVISPFLFFTTRVIVDSIKELGRKLCRSIALKHVVNSILILASAYFICSTKIPLASAALPVLRESIALLTSSHEKLRTLSGPIYLIYYYLAEISKSHNFMSTVSDSVVSLTEKSPRNINF